MIAATFGRITPLMEGKAGEGVAYKKYHRLSAAEMMYVIFSSVYLTDSCSRYRHSCIFFSASQSRCGKGFRDLLKVKILCVSMVSVSVNCGNKSVYDVNTETVIIK